MSADAAGERDIVTTRLLAWPRARVWAAFADPAALAEWWGPRGFTNTFQAFDFRPGGVWRFTMHGPDGAAFAMDKRFAEIVVPERIVLHHFQQGHGFVLTMTFAEEGTATRVQWRMRFDDAAEAARVRDFVATANAQNLERLEAHLSRRGPADDPRAV